MILFLSFCCHSFPTLLPLLTLITCTHSLSLSSFQLNKESYSIGDCVYLSPHTYSFPNVKKTSGTTTNKKQKKEEEEVHVCTTVTLTMCTHVVGVHVYTTVTLTICTHVVGVYVYTTVTLTIVLMLLGYMCILQLH